VSDLGGWFTIFCGPRSASSRQSGAPRLKEFDRERAAIAEAVERGINLFGHRQWIVAGIFDSGIRGPTWW